jgi:porin
VFAAPPSGITPPSIFGGLLSMPMGASTLTLGVWDPASAINRSGIEDAFETGVAGMASLSVPTHFGGKLGIHTMTVQATSIEGLDLNDIPDILLPPESEVVLGQAQGGVMVRYALSQYLWQDPDNPKRGWGVFAQAGVWEDNPLPFQWGMIVGLTGSAPIASRPNDRFGVGYYRISLSPPLRNGLAPVLELGDEQGVEAFYTLRFGEHVQLTFDAQYIDPFIRDLDDSVFLGARLRLATE